MRVMWLSLVATVSATVTMQYSTADTETFTCADDGVVVGYCRTQGGPGISGCGGSNTMWVACDDAHAAEIEGTAEPATTFVDNVNYCPVGTVATGLCLSSTDGCGTSQRSQLYCTALLGGLTAIDRNGTAYVGNVDTYTADSPNWNVPGGYSGKLGLGGGASVCTNTAVMYWVCLAEESTECQSNNPAGYDIPDDPIRWALGSCSDITTPSPTPSPTLRPTSLGPTLQPTSLGPTLRPTSLGPTPGPTASPTPSPTASSVAPSPSPTAATSPHQTHVIVGAVVGAAVGITLVAVGTMYATGTGLFAVSATTTRRYDAMLLENRM